ncbi:hypothetical protein D3C72_1005160 [compost metagenome]
MIVDRINDLGDQLPRFQVLPRQCGEHQQPAGRRGYRFYTGQRCRRIGQVGQGGGFAGDRAEMDQVIDQCLAITVRQRMIDVALTAQFDGHRKTARWNVEVFAEALFQLPPQQGEAFIERLAARVRRQQAGFGADVTGQRLDLRPGLRGGVQMRDRFEVAMQVEHHVGVAGQSLQGQALGLQLGVGSLSGQRFAQAAADQLPVVLRIVTELALDRVADLFTEVDEPAVEVLAAFQFVAAQWYIHQHLFQTHRVGDGYKHDFAAQATGGFQLCQALLEVPGHQHAGHFVGVQGGLDVDLAVGRLRAEVKTVDLSCGPRQRGQQVMFLVAHLLFLKQVET